jgi:hypothetical protein
MEFIIANFEVTAVNLGEKKIMKFSATIHVASKHAGAAAVLFAGALFSASAFAVDSFTATYKNGTSCGSTYNITGMEPSTAGTYPVFIYTVGTGESYTSPIATAAIQGMANRGFVAVTVDYPHSSFGNCSTLSSRAKCIFDGTNASSAINTICARAKADCNKGVVVGGLSQGSIMATLANNYDSRIRAAYAMGTHTKYSFYDLSSCMTDGKHTLTHDRLRVLNGEKDQFGGGNASSVRTQSQLVTGYSCGSSAYSCLQANGSGWYMVANGQVQDGSADHCYMLNGDGCKAGTPLDTGWLSGADAWELNANLDWLTTFVTP